MGVFCPYSISLYYWLVKPHLCIKVPTICQHSGTTASVALLNGISLPLYFKRETIFLSEVEIFSTSTVVSIYGEVLPYWLQPLIMVVATCLAMDMNL